MEPDFSGYATKAGVECSDGRTIMPGAFKHQDQVRVPLVWQHGHKDPENVLGHVNLTYLEEEGDVWADAFFNKSAKAQHMKEAVDHEDITMMSIYANEVIERSKQVLHGVIREVSLVLSGANPGALIQNVMVRHSDEEYEVEDEVIVYTGIEFKHADGESDSGDSGGDGDGPSVQEVLDGMTEEQQAAVTYLIGEAIDATKAELAQDNVGSDETDDDTEDTTVEHDDTNQEGTEMTHTNVFEKDATKDETSSGGVLSHDALKGLNEEAKRAGSSLKATIESYAIQHGIESIETLFPEATAVTNTPEWDKRRTEWVASVLGGTTKRPFSRIKSWTADITFEEARAKGYVKGNMKKEEYFSIAKRETGPQTIYKKQKLDRDDIIDITDFDVVMWMKGEMRLMLDEEIARAILVGDGRAIDDDDKIMEDKIRPIAYDDPFYVHSFGVDVTDANSSYEEVLDAMILNRQFYKGSGNPAFYTTETFIANCLLLRDLQGRKLFRNVEELASEMRVSRLVAVEILDEYPDIHGIMVNMSDYSVGTDRGGQVTMFSDFDIDYNQEKYLIETRMSGALTKPKSALVVWAVTGDTGVMPDVPTYDPDTWTVTIPTKTGVVYTDGDGNVLAAGDVVLTAGQTLNVQAWPDTNYYFTGGAKTRWSYLRPTGT